MHTLTSGLTGQVTSGGGKKASGLTNYMSTLDYEERNRRLRAIFAALRAQGKLNIRPMVQLESAADPARGVRIKLILNNPELIAEVFKGKQNLTREQVQDLLRVAIRAKVPRKESPHFQRHYEYQTDLPYNEPLAGRGYATLGKIDLANDMYPMRVMRNAKGRPPLSQVFLRTHSNIYPGWARGQRLGTAMYILGLREAKRQGYAGIYSIRGDRSPDADNVWRTLNARAEHVSELPAFKDAREYWGDEDLTDPVVNFLTTVRPHARRRGKVLRKIRQDKATFRRAVVR